jgi:hypothetical protein
MLPSRRMSLARRRVVHLLIAGVLGGNLASLVFDLQLWPFSPYAMFADARDADVPTMERLVLVGEPRSGGEFWFESQGYLGRAVSPMIVSAVFTTALARGLDDVQARLRETAEYYERLRSRGATAAPPLSRLHLYRFTWALRPDLANLRTPDRVLIASYVPAR